MREEKRYGVERLWYLGGLIPVAIVTLAWTIMENQAVPQRILLFVIGAALGGLALYSAGEYLRPSGAIAQSEPLVSQKDREPNVNSSKNSPTINAGGNVSIGHIGDVTINQTPQPELKLGLPKSSTNADGTASLSVEAIVESPYPPANLRIEAWAEGIISFEAVPQRSGMAMFGHTGVRPDHAFTNVQQPFGSYLLVVKTKSATNIDLRYDFN